MPRCLTPRPNDAQRERDNRRTTYQRSDKGHRAGCPAPTSSMHRQNDDYNLTMPGYDPRKHHRRSLRLPGWDYRSAATYFVTICTHQREHLFNEPVWAEIVTIAWEAIPNQVDRAVLDEWILMPNHLHGILALTDDPDHSLPVGPLDPHWLPPANVDVPQSLTNAPAGSLGSIIRGFKAAVTRQINRRRQTPSGKVWQRGYYERIVRDTEELERIRAYIKNNPERWAASEDDLNRLLTRMNLRV